MCNIIGGVTTLVVGASLVIVSTVLTFVFVPDVIEDLIINEVVLLEDTIQMERFEEVPFSLNFTVRIFNITNTEEVLQGGVPVVTEVGPYIYKMYQRRERQSIEEDNITYKLKLNFEFDAESSYPNTEDDIVTIVNLPYHAILQTAETSFPELMSILNMALNGVFGEYNSPIVQVRLRDFLFDGIRLCQSPGIIAGIACSQIRALGESSNNLEMQDDGSIVFSLLSQREKPGLDYKVYRGINNAEDLGRFISINGSSFFDYWADHEDEASTATSVCNMINGTDSAIYNPFVDRERPLYAVNGDICRAVELRYQHDTVYEEIPAVRFTANEWFLDNDDGCFCLNATPGINRPDGCLFKGAMELFSCTGAPLVLSYPHFLYADPVYANGVVGMDPEVDNHRIFVDLEPNTGTVLRGAKRAQFNIFLRPITSVAATNNLNIALTPIVWVEESVVLPEEFVVELKSRLLAPLNLVDILLPIAIAVCCVVFLLGVAIILRTKLRGKHESTTVTT